MKLPGASGSVWDRFCGVRTGKEIRPGLGRMEAASWASVSSLWSPNPPLISLHSVLSVLLSVHK